MKLNYSVYKMKLHTPRMVYVLSWIKAMPQIFIITFTISFLYPTWATVNRLLLSNTISNTCIVRSNYHSIYM